MAEDPRYHIRVSCDELGKYVIMPGDRGRVPRIAKYLENAEKKAENREYLTYTGTLDGVPVSVVSSGMGGPCISIGVEELLTCGVHTIIRVGTTGALQKNLKLGDSIIATAAVRKDGTSGLYVPYEFPAVGNLDAISALVEGAKKIGNPYHTGVVYSTDAYYARTFAKEESAKYTMLLKRAGVLCVEMEVATLYTLSAIKGFRAGAILTIREEIVSENEVIQAGEKYEAGLEKSIQIAIEAIRILIKQDKR